MEQDKELLLSFFAEAEDYCEEITRGLGLINSNQISAGIDVVLRPLHTLKGTSGFIGGLENISHFTHKVEGFLKDVQNRKIPAMPQTMELMTRSVDMVFIVIEEAKNGTKMGNTAYKEVVASIEKMMHPEPQKNEEKIDIIRKKDVCFIKINMKRVHLPSQYEPIINIFDKLKNGENVVLDLSQVRTINSTAWGAIWVAGERMNISVVGLSESCKATFLAWGFDGHINSFKTEADFWKSIELCPN